MKKILLVAIREFTATVFTRAFILGLVLTPAIGALAATLFPRLMTRGVQVQGQIAVIDPSGAVGQELADALSADRITERRTDQTRQALIQAPESVRQVAGNDAGRAARFALGSVPQFTIVQRPPDTDPQQEKAWLTDDQASAAPPGARGHPSQCGRSGRRGGTGTTTSMCRRTSTTGWKTKSTRACARPSSTRG